MVPERLGDGLEIESRPGFLRLMIQPRKVRLKPGVWIGLIVVNGLVLAGGFGLWKWVGGPFSSGGSGKSWQDTVWFVWLTLLLLFGGTLMMFISMGMRRRVLLLRDPTDPGAMLTVRIRHPFSGSRTRLGRDEVENLRLQTLDAGSPPNGEKDKLVFGHGDWWLRFETVGDEAYAINLPVDEARVNRLAGMIGEIFGQECRVVETAEEPTS